MAIQNGTYRARACGEVVLGESSKKGTPFIECYFQITEGDNKGGKVRWTSYFNEKTNERSIESLQFCGWQGEDLSEFADGGLHGLDKNEVDVVIELEEYEKDGEKRSSPKVQWVNRGGGFLNTAQAMDHEKASSFGERMRGLVLAMKTKSTKDTDFAHGANTTPNGTPEPATAGTGPARKAF